MLKNKPVCLVPDKKANLLEILVWSDQLETTWNWVCISEYVQIVLDYRPGESSYLRSLIPAIRITTPITQS